MLCMLASGNINPQSMRMIVWSGSSAACLLDRHAVAADLAVAAEEDDPDARGVGRTRRTTLSHGAATKRSVDTTGGVFVVRGVGPIGDLHSPTA